MENVTKDLQTEYEFCFPESAIRSDRADPKKATFHLSFKVVMKCPLLITRTPSKTGVVNTQGCIQRILNMGWRYATLLAVRGSAFLMSNITVLHVC